MSVIITQYLRLVMTLCLSYTPSSHTCCSMDMRRARSLRSTCALLSTTEGPSRNGTDENQFPLIATDTGTKTVNITEKAVMNAEVRANAWCAPIYHEGRERDGVERGGAGTGTGQTASVWHRCRTVYT